jgi:hypothetical protein
MLRYLTYKGLPWVIVLTMTVAHASCAIEPLQNKIILCGAVFWVIFSIAGWYLADQITRPLMKTSSIAKLLINTTDNTPGYKHFLPLPSSPSSLFGHRRKQTPTMYPSASSPLESLSGVDLPRYLKDEVYTMCKSVNLLMHTIAEQRLMTDLLEKRVEERTEVLSEEVKCRIAMQAAAEEARRAAEAAEAGKSRFLANMSHGIIYLFYRINPNKKIKKIFKIKKIKFKKIINK